MRIHTGAIVLSSVLAMSGLAHASVIVDESVDGDLSTDPAAPTAVAFALGSNIINGTISSPADTRDYITFTIAPGEALAALNLLNWEDLPGGGPGDTGFNAIIAGPTSFIPDGANIGSFLGANHVIESFQATDLLPDLALAPFGGSGFTTPLGPGVYSYHIQQTGPELTGYSLEFVVTPSPAPAAMLGLGGLVALRRNRGGSTC